LRSLISYLFIYTKFQTLPEVFYINRHNQNHKPIIINPLTGTSFPEAGPVKDYTL